eukprot:596360-Rhodomonas_salina.5
MLSPSYPPTAPFPAPTAPFPAPVDPFPAPFVADASPVLWYRGTTAQYWHHSAGTTVLVPQCWHRSTHAQYGYHSTQHSTGQRVGR